jgi:hypothetical protein
MASTTFSGPVTSTNGFIGGVTASQTLTTSSAAASKATATVPAAFGSSTLTDPMYAFGSWGRVTGPAQTGTANYMAGAFGLYSITGTNASKLPKAGVLGAIGDGTTSADAAVMALLDGDTASTTARAGFGITTYNSTAASGFDYGMDLNIQVIDGSTYVRPYKKAEWRVSNEVVFMTGAGAPTDGTTGDNFAGPGSLYVDYTNANVYIQASLITTPVWKLVTRAA